MQALNEWSVVVNGTRVFTPSSRLTPLVGQQQDAIRNNFRMYVLSVTGPLRSDYVDVDGGYGYFYIKDIARRLDAGIGSQGVERYYVLIEGPSKSNDDDLILDLKQVEGVKT